MADTSPEERSARMTPDLQSVTSESTRGRSFSFLRRSPSKDSDQSITRSTSLGRRLTKRRKGKNKQSAVPEVAPRLPSYTSLPTINGPLPPAVPSTQQHLPSSRSGFHRPLNFNSVAYFERKMDIERSPPLGPQGYGDPHGRSESMTNRSRYSYGSTVEHGSDNPRRMRRRKDPTPFNVLVVGAKNCGKTSFINFLKTALATPAKLRPTTPSPAALASRNDASGPFTSQYLETELEGERVGLTLYDSKGLERPIVDLQLKDMSDFLEKKFEETFAEESKVKRATGVRDTHIHCVLLLLDPSRLASNIAAASPKAQDADENVYVKKPRFVGTLDKDLDIEVIRTLENKTTVIPVISKADTVTSAHMAFLKRSVWSTLKQIGHDPLAALNLDSDSASDTDESRESILEEEDEEETVVDDSSAMNGHRNLAVPKLDELRMSALSMNADLPDLPMSLISPDMHDPGVIGRRFPWGFADPYNAEHCDFVRLKENVFNDWRSELREASRERWYEGWRTNRLKRTTPSPRPATQNTLSPGVNGNGNGQRSVSDKVAYISGPPMRTAPLVPQTRAVSANEIGVAVSDPPRRNGYPR